MFQRVVILIVVMGASGAFAGDELPEAKGGNTIGYPTVSAALEALKAKSGTKVTVQDGWTLIEDTAGDDVTLWTFTPAGHPAHPSAVKRTLLTTKDGQINLQMRVRCEAEKAPCDALVKSFQALNAEMKQFVRSGK